jgi:integrase
MPRAKPTPRRLTGEGTVQFQAESNLWVGRLSLGIDPRTGRRIRPGVTGRTQQEVSRKLAELRVKKLGGQAVVASRESVSFWLGQWFETYYKPHHKPNTVAKVKGSISRIKASPLAEIPLSKLSQDEVQNWINSLGATFAEATIRTTLCTLSMSLERLVKQKKLVFNPAADVKVPLNARKAVEARAMDPEVLKRFLEATEKSPYRVPILFMLNTGMRSGEMCALDIEDYQPRIRICKSWSSAANAIQQSTKTASSTRTIPCPAALDPIMKRHLFSLHHKAPTDPLFQTVTRAHGRLKPTHLDDIVGDIADSIGEPWITPHSLRHSFASTLFRQGVKINVVSNLLGHKDVSTTYGIYIHMVPQEMDEAAEAVGKVMLGG